MIRIKPKNQKKLKDKTREELMAEIQVHLPTDTEQEQLDKTIRNIRIGRIMRERRGD